MAGYSQLKSSTSIVAVNIMIFNYILSSLTNPIHVWLKVIVQIWYQKQIGTFISFPVSFKTSFISGRFTVANERHFLSVVFYAGIFQNAMNQSLRGTKAPKTHDAVPVFSEHPLKILNAKTIKFWYNEGELVQFCTQRSVHGQAIERK